MAAPPRTIVSARLIAAICVAITFSMVGLAYAAVPLYRIFCQITGYGGTTQVAAQASEEIGERAIKVRFDANVDAELPWSFKPVTPSMDVRIGESALGFYRATSLAGSVTAGSATFNVTPLAAGQYFNKMDCFCFTEQQLQGGASAEFPVSFFIDPDIDNDHDLDGVTTITLSYTYFAIEPDTVETSLDAVGVTGQSEMN